MIWCTQYSDFFIPNQVSFSFTFFSLILFLIHYSLSFVCDSFFTRDRLFRCTSNHPIPCTNNFKSSFNFERLSSIFCYVIIFQISASPHCVSIFLSNVNFHSSILLLARTLFLLYILSQSSLWLLPPDLLPV